MNWIADVIGILLVIFLAWFFVDGMFPDPPKKPPRKLDEPIKPYWR